MYHNVVSCGLVVVWVSEVGACCRSSSVWGRGKVFGSQVSSLWQVGDGLIVNLDR